ncbi:putative reverse transcriptase domain-containing protein, partial [Tanacetum coccineum]
MPAISPFLSSTDDSSDTRSSPPLSPIRQILPEPPGLPRRQAILVLPGQPIPIGRPYRTQPNGVLKMLTARKSVGSLPTLRLASRYLSDSSSRHSSGYAISDSSDDSLTSHSVGPSCKRCRSPADSVPSLTPASGSLASTRADLLPPLKRFRDSHLSETSIEEDIEVGTAEAEVDLELVIGDEIVVRDRVEIDAEECKADSSAEGTIEVGIDLMSAPAVDEESESARGDSSDSSSTRGDSVRLVEDMHIDLGDAVRDFYHHMSEIRIDGVVNRVDSLRLDKSRSQEEFCEVCKERNEVRRRLRRTMTITRFGMTPEAIEKLVTRRVEEALAAYEATRTANALEDESQSQNGSDGDNRNEENGNGGGDKNGNGNGNNGGNNDDGNENRDTNGRGDRPVAREYESVFHISKVKYATCTLLDSALTWWNSHNRTIGTIAAYALSWRELLKLMTEVYCPRNEIQKMETELWNLSVKNNDMATYTQRFQELTMMCTKMVPEEEDRVEKFIRGLPDNIQGNRGQMVHQRDVTCFECGAQGHYRKDCPKIKNHNRGNKARVPDHHGFQHYHGALLDITPSALDISYAVKLADGRTLETNTVLRGYTLGLLGHPFNINLMPIELGSFDVIIGMDWLAKNHAVIVYDEKIV